MQTPGLKYYSQAAIKAPLPALNVAAYLRQVNQGNLDAPALDYLGTRLSYRQFLALIDHAAAAFAALGVKKGDIVGACLLMTPESLVVFYALAQIGAVTNWLDPRSSSSELKDYLWESKSRYLVTLSLFGPKLAPILEATKVKTVVTLSPLTSAGPAIKILGTLKQLLGKPTRWRGVRVYSWAKFLALVSPQAPPPRTVYQKSLPVTIVHTGGTTGQPKGVILTHDNLNVSVFQCLFLDLHWPRGESWFAYIPPFLIAGLANDVHLPLILGMRTILIPNFNLIKLAGLIVKAKPNHIPSIALHWREMMASPLIKADTDLSFLRTVLIGGDVMTAEMEKQINQFLQAHGYQSSVSKCWGMSEVTSATTAGCAGAAYNELGSSGIPMVKTTVKIVAAGTQKELPLGQTGELCLTGPNVMLGYLGQPKVTKETLRRHRDGKTWLHTGDLAHLTKDGVLYLDGRLKRMIIRRGFKTFPSLIEKVLREHPGVKECLVVGVNDSEEDQVPRAHIVLTAEFVSRPAQVEAQLRKLCQAKLPDYAWPKVYRFETVIPLTANGKADYRLLEGQP